MQVESPLLDRKAAAEYIGVSFSWFESTIRKEIPALKRGRRHMYRREDLDAWIRLNVEEPSRLLSRGETQEGQAADVASLAGRAVA